MSYVDAGYAIALGVLAFYALALVVRRRRVERAARAWAGPDPEAGGVGTDDAGAEPPEGP